MNVLPDLVRSFSGLYDVFLLFLIPIGGGIPAGVILAQSRSIHWPTIMALYFVSDVVLALIFEPVVLLLRWAGTRYPHIARLNAAIKASTHLMISKYQVSAGPIALILLAFGVDPMTGRTAALAVGHGFIVGWLLAIIGDMIFFTAIMASTLWLNNILGDGTWTAVIIMVAMLVIPALVRYLRKRSPSNSTAGT